LRWGVRSGDASSVTVERFLKDLEKQLAKMSPADRAKIISGLQKIAAGVEELGGKFRPSMLGAVGVLRELSYGMSAGRPFRLTVEKAKTMAGKIGPHVDTFLRAF
jgi:hypothetical protein